MTNENAGAFTLEELERETGSHLPTRQLMATIGLAITVGVALSVEGLPALPGTPELPGATLSVG